MIDLGEALARQAGACAALGSPLYAKVMELLREEWDGRDALRALVEEAWRGRSFAIWYERPLLLAATLHEMALARPGEHPLAAAYPSCGGDPARLDRRRVQQALELLAGSTEARAFLRSGYVQTNETSRGVIWLWPLAALAAAMPAEIELHDLGCSAGLNLVADRLAPAIGWTDLEGKPLALEPIPRIVRRVGYDRAPVDIESEVAVRRLRAAVWPDDAARFRRLELALSTARALHARGELALETCDLLDMPARIRQTAGRTAVIYHTVATDYLSPENRAELERRLGALLLELPERTLWLGFESAGTAPLFELRACWHVGGELRRETVARARPHPLALKIDHDALARLGAT